MEALNRIELTGSVVAMDAMRYTPAGIPVVEFRLSHESTQPEAGRPRTVAIEALARAAGPAAKALSNAAPGARVRVAGFLAPKGKSRTQLLLIVNEFEFI